MPRTATIAAILTTLALTIAPPPPATAGTYTVYTCRTPSGTATTADGWSATATAPVQDYDPGVARSCASDALSMEFGDTQLPVMPGSAHAWKFTAPPGTTIGSLRATRTFDLGWLVQTGVYGRPYIYDVWSPEHDGNPVESYVPPWNSNVVGDGGLGAAIVWRSLRWNAMNFRLQCSDFMGAADCGPYRAKVMLSNVVVGLHDEHVPHGTASPSSLRGDAGAVRGVGVLAFSAIDVGGGVYRSILSVDGVEVRRSVVQDNGGSCGDVEAGNGDAYEFGTSQPCPSSARGEATFDTRGLRDGSHTVRLEIEDAAGNVTLVHDGQFRTHNAPIAISPPTLAGDARVGGALAVDVGDWDGAPSAYDRRWLRCDASGSNCTPIAGASGATYAPTAADAYHRLVAEITAENAAGTTVARTAASGPVADEHGRTSPGGPPPGPDPDPGPDDGGRDDDQGDPPPNGGPGAAAAAPPRIDAQGVGGLANPVAEQGGHAANGTNASRRARLSIALRRPTANAGASRRVRVRYGRGATVVGRLVDEGDRPIQGARLTIATRVPGRSWVARGTVRTDADGRLLATLRPGPSRAVRLTYFAFADSRRFIASNTVNVDVVSPVTIHANRHRVTGKRVVVLSGRAGGRPAPAGGVLVTLQGYQRGYGWRTFRTVRAARSGRWSTRYRFRSSSGRFAFRAIVPQQGGHPFTTARSRAVTVTVT